MNEDEWARTLIGVLVREISEWEAALSNVDPVSDTGGDRAASLERRILKAQAVIGEQLSILAGDDIATIDQARGVAL